MSAVIFSRKMLKMVTRVSSRLSVVNTTLFPGPRGAWRVHSASSDGRSLLRMYFISADLASSMSTSDCAAAASAKFLSRNASSILATASSRSPTASQEGR